MKAQLFYKKRSKIFKLNQQLYDFFNPKFNSTSFAPQNFPFLFKKTHELCHLFYTSLFDSLYISYQMMDRYIALFCIVSYASACLMLTSDSNSELTALRNAELAKHNEKRAIHGSPALTLNATLNTAAQAYAEYLATIFTLEHSAAAKAGNYGQNLYWGWGAPTYTYPTAGASESWYNEVQYYNYQTFTTTNSGKQVGHFTAMVWKASTSAGFGYAKVPEDGGFSIYVVANYYPTPNMIGSYASNVIAPR